MASGWTTERRTRQAQLIRGWKPWKRATGPRSAAGKVKASRNAYKGGHGQMLRDLSRLVNAELRAAKDLLKRVNC